MSNMVDSGGIRREGALLASAGKQTGGSMGLMSNEWGLGRGGEAERDGGTFAETPQ